VAPPELVAFLGHPDDAVRARAALRMGTFRAANVAELLRDALRAAEARTRAAARTALLHQARTPDGFDLARDAFREQIRERDVVLAAEAAHALAGLDALGDLVASLAPGEERAPVRLAYARGLLAATAASDGTGSRASLAATLLASVLGDPKVDVSAREAALDAFDDVPPRETRAVALPLLVRGDATPELLWLLVEHGAPEDAPRVARWAAREPYARASAAVAALEAIVDRAGSTGLGRPRPGHARGRRPGEGRAARRPPAQGQRARRRARRAAGGGPGRAARDARRRAGARRHVAACADPSRRPSPPSRRRRPWPNSLRRSRACARAGRDRSARPGGALVRRESAASAGVRSALVEPSDRLLSLVQGVDGASPRARRTTSGSFAGIERSTEVEA
jgi:hypothetical protein